MSDLDRLVARLNAHARTETAALPAAGCASCSPEERLGLAFVPGDRVVDLITGQKGIIRAGTRATYLVQAAQRENR